MAREGPTADIIDAPATGHTADRGRARLLGWVLALAWAALIFWQSETTGAGGLLGRLPDGSDKVAHAIGYLALSAFLTLATGRPALAAALAALYGVTDEVHQAFVPGRRSDALDVVADAVGAAVGAWLAWRLLSRRRRTRA